MSHSPASYLSSAENGATKDNGLLSSTPSSKLQAHPEPSFSGDTAADLRPVGLCSYQRHKAGIYDRPKGEENNHSRRFSHSDMGKISCLLRCPERWQLPHFWNHQGCPQGRGFGAVDGRESGIRGDDGLLLTLQRFPIYHPLDSGFGVPIGSTHQPPILTRSQDKVLGFVQPVGSSWKTRTAQAGGQMARAGRRGQTEFLQDDRSL